MAITIHQVPNNIEDASLIYPHSSNVGSYITAISTIYSNYFDFQYHFRIYDDSGLIFDTLQTPTHNGLGILNIKNVIESFTTMNLDSVEQVTSTEFLKEYKISVQEFYSNVISTTNIEAPADHGTETFATKSLAANYRYNENDSIIPFKIDNVNWGNIFTNMQPRLRYKTGWQATASMYIAGDTDPTYFPGVEYSKIVYILHSKTINPAHPWYGLVTKWFYTLMPLAQYSFDPTDLTVTSDYIRGALKVPVGIKNLDVTSIHREGYINPETGVWVSTSITQTGILHNLQSGIDSGDVEIVGLDIRLQDGTTWIDESDVVSNIYSWDFNPCDTKEIDINWQNSYGGIDYFSFNKIREDEMIGKQKSYKHNSLKISSNRVHNELNETNISSYSNDNAYIIEVKTDFLKKHEIDLLKGLFSSAKQTMWIDGERYVINRISNKQKVALKEKPGFIMYKFKVEYSKIIR